MLYLFDGYNILHASRFRDRDELIDQLASFVALRGARGVVVFDGVGDDVTRGDLSVRFATDADGVIERLGRAPRAGGSVGDLLRPGDPGHGGTGHEGTFVQGVLEGPRERTSKRA